MIKAILFILMMMTIFPAVAQQKEWILTGKLLDAESGKPIFSASVKGSYWAITDQYGGFRIKVKPGEILTFSHIGYQAVLYTVGDLTEEPVVLFLTVANIELGEVEVRPFISEEKFKNEILNAVPEHEYQHQLAGKNLQVIRQIAPLSYANDLTSYNTFFKNAKSIHEISFISSNPSVGILKAIRQLGNRKTLESPPLPQRPLKEPWNPYGVRKKGHWKDYLEHQ